MNSGLSCAGRKPNLVETVLSAGAWMGISFVTVFWCVPISVVFLLRRVVDPRLELAHGFASMWGRNLVALAPGSSVKVTGAESVLTQGPVIFMANHQSYVDVPLLFHVRRHFKWMADAGLFHIPFFGWAMRMSGYIPVNRGNPKDGIRSLEQAKEWLSRGVSVFIFPEGTRSRTGLFSRFQTGGFRLAVATGIPIVPVVVVGARQMLPRRSWIFRAGTTLYIEVLPPVYPKDSDPRSIHLLAVQVRNKMLKAYARLLKEAR